MQQKLGGFKILDRLINSPDTMRKSLELRTGAKTPQQVSDAIAMQFNEAAARSTGSQIPNDRKCSTNWTAYRFWIGNYKSC